MVVGFADGTTEDIYHGHDTKAARRVPKGIWPVAQRKIDMLNATAVLNDLRSPPGNRLERLRRNLAGMYSSRVNDQWRIIFRFEGGNGFDVRIADYH